MKTDRKAVVLKSLEDALSRKPTAEEFDWALNSEPVKAYLGMKRPPRDAGFQLWNFFHAQLAPLVVKLDGTVEEPGLHNLKRFDESVPEDQRVKTPAEIQTELASLVAQQGEFEDKWHKLQIQFEVIFALLGRRPPFVVEINGEPYTILRVEGEYRIVLGTAKGVALARL